MAARSGETEPPDPVRQNQLLCERVRKELQHQRLHTEFGVNPLHRGEAAQGQLLHRGGPAGSSAAQGTGVCLRGAGQGQGQAPQCSAARTRRAAAPKNASSGQGEGQTCKEQPSGLFLRPRGQSAQHRKRICPD